MTPLYTAMDAAYDAHPIRTLCHDLGIMSLIDSNPRGQDKIPMYPAKAKRYKSQSSVERSNSLLKECFGDRHVRVRGPEKVFAHLMFGIVALTATQLLRLGMPWSPQDPPLSDRKERFVFMQPPKGDFCLKKQENGDRSVKRKSV